MKEEFTTSQTQLLQKFVTSTTSNIFALRNLPEVIKGALFSRYSRSTLGLRSLLLKEFLQNAEAGFQEIDDRSEKQRLAVQKAQSFYDRILDGYGDDSIGELGGAHLAVEGVSMLAAKVLEDSRIGGSPLEKSTRYIYFDQKIDGEYQYHREQVLMTSAFKDLYISTCDSLFETYSALIPKLTAVMEKGFPHDPAISKTAYAAALRAKVLDCLRGLLPASALTNMGIFGNGRFFEGLLQKLHCHNLSEMQEIGKKTHIELSKEIPSFVRRADPSHRHCQAYAQFAETVQRDLKRLRKSDAEVETGSNVRLLHFDPQSPALVAGAMLFASGSAPLHDLQEYCRSLSEEELARILDVAASSRENRRHKSPRALEHANFTFEITADFGVYRDLHRHRMLTQERQLLSCNLGYYIPEEILGTEMEDDYRAAMERAKSAYDQIAEALPEEAQYIVPMAYNVRWYFQVNLRALQWLTELRSQAAGHPIYRLIAQEMARQVSTAVPAFERFFKFVDYNGYQLGRLSAEIRSEEKQKQRV